MCNATARAVKAVDEQIQVGGSATAGLGGDVCGADFGPLTIKDFLTYCDADDTTVDMVTTHLYPTDGIATVPAGRDGFAVRSRVHALLLEQVRVGPVAEHLEVFHALQRGVVVHHEGRRVRRVQVPPERQAETRVELGHHQRHAIAAKQGGVECGARNGRPRRSPRSRPSAS